MSDNALRPDHLLVIDPRVTGWPSHLIAAGPNAAVLILDHNRDGLQQVNDVAANYAPLTGITLVGHGSPGLLLLGHSVLDATSLSPAGNALHRLGASLADAARIHILGLPGAGVSGRYLAHRLAHAIGRTVVTEHLHKRPALLPSARIAAPAPLAGGAPPRLSLVTGNA
ncbi:DUF4347 domain-containing protein [Teichococcus vastitatis]|uniref:DUF4347 domain-containing protein n=1 Tax=Teichococcus vastitatis TaxID=2307076 RepID=A0ABS9W1E7_9PROT|nr:DUF4347 domain-containing protein [Pseudoroseomonas vastitatis]MCI0753013.1 DUF4347 domain-containing protein [Pseudoroseomonas vastitatis]